LHEIHLHVLHFISPLQRHYIRILLLVPLYAVESWLALRYKEQRIYLEVLRESYEALVIWSFMKLLLDFTRPVAQQALAARPYSHARLMAPLCCCHGCRLADGSFVRWTSFGVFQYVIVRLTMAFASLVAQWAGTLCEGEWHGRCLFPYSTSLINLSQLVAMYCLVLFYYELKAELAPLRPLGKFLAIKALVFLTFWQSVVVQGMAQTGVISDTLTYSSDDVAAGVQDFLICVEMAVLALVHHYVFSVDEFLEGGDLAEKAPLFPGGRVRSLAAARNAFNAGEMAHELRSHFGNFFGSGRGKGDSSGYRGQAEALPADGYQAVDQTPAAAEATGSTLR